jgi:hypothetical protein
MSRNLPRRERSTTQKGGKSLKDAKALDWDSAEPAAETAAYSHVASVAGLRAPCSISP